MRIRPWRRTTTWDKVYDEIHIVPRHPAYIPLPPVTDADLDEDGARLGSRLPLSYRAFMKRFGPGFLENCVRLNPITSWTWQGIEKGLVEETHTQREHFASREGWPDWLARAVFFGDNGGGDSFAWDSECMRVPEAQECTIYEVSDWSSEPKREAESFLGFIENALAAVRRWRAEVSQQTSAADQGFAFEPLFLRMKEQPKRGDVIRWLAFDNSTVHDLALAIRDHGRTEALPVLADALEEAGCANADVLDSCRRGDPDIDGLWVLRVLLGRSRTKAENPHPPRKAGRPLPQRRGGAWLPTVSGTIWVAGRGTASFHLAPALGEVAASLRAAGEGSSR